MRAHKILVRFQYGFFIAGVSALGYCALVIGAATYYQARARDRLWMSTSGLAARTPPPSPVSDETVKLRSSVRDGKTRNTTLSGRIHKVGTQPGSWLHTRESS